jgi:hypothetical protein
MSIDPNDPLGINDGSRPSRLDLDRRLMGEVPGDIPSDHREAIEAAARDLPPLDLAGLRSRARVTERPKRRPQRWMFAGLLTMGALAATATLVVQTAPPTAAPMVRTKGSATIGWMVLHHGDVRIGDSDQAVEPGDQIQFTWAGAASTAVIIGVDGSDTPTVLWPRDEQGEPVSLNGTSGMLDGSVTLDDAPGPERFFAVFDAPSVRDAVRQVSVAIAAADSPEALLEWGDRTPGVDVIILEKHAP